MTAGLLDGGSYVSPIDELGIWPFVQPAKRQR